MKLKINGERRERANERERPGIIEIGNNYGGPSDSSIAFRFVSSSNSDGPVETARAAR